MLLALLLGLMLLAVTAPPRADGARAVADLRIDRDATEGPRGTIVATVWGRCDPGYEFADLLLDFSQGDVVTPTSLGQPFPCDGERHPQQVTSLEAFEPGPAILTARLTVIDSVTGDPAPQAVATQEIDVRAAAEIELPRTAHLRDGVVTLVVRARCDEPWVMVEFRVSATQGEFPTIGFDDALLDLTCDGDVHRVTVQLTSAGTPFQGGPLLVEATIDLLDPEFFDPVTQARATRTVKLV